MVLASTIGAVRHRLRSMREPASRRMRLRIRTQTPRAPVAPIRSQTSANTKGLETPMIVKACSALPAERQMPVDGRRRRSDRVRWYARERRRVPAVLAERHRAEARMRFGEKASGRDRRAATSLSKRTRRHLPRGACRSIPCATHRSEVAPSWKTANSRRNRPLGSRVEIIIQSVARMRIRRVVIARTHRRATIVSGR